MDRLSEQHLVPQMKPTGKGEERLVHLDGCCSPRPIPQRASPVEKSKVWRGGAFLLSSCSASLLVPNVKNPARASELVWGNPRLQLTRTISEKAKRRRKFLFFLFFLATVKQIATSRILPVLAPHSKWTMDSCSKKCFARSSSQGNSQC